MEKEVLDILMEITGTDEIKEDRDINLFEDGLLDSLGMIELLVQLEEKLGIVIEPTEVDRKDIETPNKIIEYLSKRN